jgi:hypothetical protein
MDQNSERQVRHLAASVLLWSIAMFASGVAIGLTL